MQYNTLYSRVQLQSPELLTKFLKADSGTWKKSPLQETCPLTAHFRVWPLQGEDDKFRRLPQTPPEIAQQPKEVTDC